MSDVENRPAAVREDPSAATRDAIGQGVEQDQVDEEQARLEALRMAVENARREAEVIAEAMGVPLGPPLEVRGTPAPVAPVRARASLAMAAEAVTPVEPTRQTVRATVTIRYRLGG